MRRGVPGGRVGGALVEAVLRSYTGRRILQAAIRRTMRGPSDEVRARGHSLIWGEVADAAGRRAVSRLRTPEAYSLTVDTALAYVSNGRWAASANLASRPRQGRLQARPDHEHTRCHPHRRGDLLNHLRDGSRALFRFEFYVFPHPRLRVVVCWFTLGRVVLGCGVFPVGSRAFTQPRALPPLYYVQKSRNETQPGGLR